MMRRFILWLIQVANVIGRFQHHGSYYQYQPKIEKEHAYTMYTTERSRLINGSDVLVSHYEHTPDFRVEEPPFYRYRHTFLREEERPYRISPAYKQLMNWSSKDNADNLGCACTTVFKRTHLLAGCAVLTLRHVLTTATSTELVLRSRRHFERMEGILGLWYDTSRNVFNSSTYATPVRIHYHPRYMFPKQVNRSHPLPVVWDLAIWTAMRTFYGSWFNIFSSTYVCDRGGSHKKEFGSSVPGPNEMAILVGFQFMKAFHRKPMPWFKYAVRTRKHILPCPKTEWGWYHCVIGNWAKLGMDSGATMFRSLEGRSWRYDGLIGINAVSMVLRSYEMIHYFRVLNCHEVLDFVYNAITSKLKYTYLDQRFQDTKMRAPVLKKNKQFKIPFYNYVGYQHYWDRKVPNYK